MISFLVVLLLFTYGLLGVYSFFKWVGHMGEFFGEQTAKVLFQKKLLLIAKLTRSWDQLLSTNGCRYMNPLIWGIQYTNHPLYHQIYSIYIYTKNCCFLSRSLCLIPVMLFFSLNQQKTWQSGKT